MFCLIKLRIKNKKTTTPNKSTALKKNIKQLISNQLTFLKIKSNLKINQILSKL